MIFYTSVVVVYFFIFLYINFKLLFKNKYWPLLFMLFYAYITPIMSNLVLEYGFYIIEEERTSYFTGSTLRLLVYISIFFISFYATLKLIKNKINNNTLNIISLNKFNFILLGFATFVLVLLYINLFMSDIPLFSDSVNRFNYWERAKLPILEKILGSRSTPLAMIFGIYYFIFTVSKKIKLKRIVLYLFLFYIIYLYLLGHKLSPQLLAVYFFILPLWIYNIKTKLFQFTFKLLLKVFIIVFLALSIIVYYYQSTGISEMAGGPILGILYRIFVLQGHLYWGIDQMVFEDSKYGMENFEFFLDLKFDGLLELMYAIGPSNLQSYLDNNVRFSSGYPAILIFFNPYYALVAQFMIGFVLALFYAYTYSVLMGFKIYRSFASILISYYIYFGLSMGDFRFLSSVSFYIMILFVTATELLYVYQRKAKIND